MYGLLHCYTLTNNIINNKRDLRVEIERRKRLENQFESLESQFEQCKKLENQLADDLVSMIELYSYCISDPNSMPKERKTDILHKSMKDIFEYMEVNQL